MSEGEDRYISRGTFESKITEMLYKCWDIRRMPVSDTALFYYVSTIKATYMVLPNTTKVKARRVLELLDEPIKVRKELYTKINPLRRNNFILLKRYEVADEALSELVKALDEDGLLVMKNAYTPWLIGVDEGKFNPEKGKVPEYNEVVEAYLKKLEEVKEKEIKSRGGAKNGEN